MNDLRFLALGAMHFFRLYVLDINYVGKNDKSV